MFQNFQLFDVRTQIPVTQVAYFPKFLREEEINHISRFTEEFEYQNADIFGQKNAPGMNVRRSKIKWLIWKDKSWWLYEKIMNKVKEYNQTAWDFDLFGINEYLQYTEYHSLPNKEGHYDWHLDVSHEGLASNRKLSFECILTDEHLGGEFSILLGPSEHKVKLQKGDLVIFPSFLLNKVYPVTEGTRKSIVGWISGPSFK